MHNINDGLDNKAFRRSILFKMIKRSVVRVLIPIIMTALVKFVMYVAIMAEYAHKLYSSNSNITLMAYVQTVVRICE